MSPFWEKFFIKDFGGRAEVVPNLVQRLVVLRDGRKGGQAVGDQVTEQIGQGFAATLRLRDEPSVVALLDPNRIGHGLHVYNLTAAMWPLQARFHDGRAGGPAAALSIEPVF